MKHHVQSRPLPAYSCTINPKGELLLPKKVCHLLGWLPEMEVTIELTNAAIVIRPKQAFSPITADIASMGLPVADWEQMEQEIEKGRVA